MSGSNGLRAGMLVLSGVIAAPACSLFVDSYGTSNAGEAGGSSSTGGESGSGGDSNAAVDASRSLKQSFGFLALEDCVACLERACRIPLETCHAVVGCDEHLACWSGASDPAEVDACREGVVDPNAPTEVMECARSAECEAPCEARGRWDCVEQFEWPPGEPGGTVDVSWVMTDLNFTQLKEADRFEFWACRGLDGACEPDANTPNDSSDSEGFVTLTLDLTSLGVGFAGFFRAHDTLGEYLPIRDYKSRPFYRSRRPLLGEREGVVWMRKEQLDGLASAGNIPIVPDTGYIAARINACDDVRHAAGVRLELAEDVPDTVRTYYTVFEGGAWVPDFSATETQAGAGPVMFNVPPGPYTVLVLEAATGREVGRLRVFVEPDTVTEVAIWPAAL